MAIIINAMNANVVVILIRSYALFALTVLILFKIDLVAQMGNVTTFMIV